MKHDGHQVPELENQILMRLPMAEASRLRDILKSNAGHPLSKRLSINFKSDMRHATMKLDDVVLHAKLMDLPCIIETLKTLDKKNFYKTNNVSQILVCKPEPEPERDLDKLPQRKIEKLNQWSHGITPPLKNVRKKRFRKTLKKKYMDAPELEKELKSLLRRDLEASEVKYELVDSAEPSTSTANENNSMADEKPNVTDIQKPPNNNVTSDIGMSDLFGGGVSSSDDEGEEMARALMATSIETQALNMQSNSELMEAELELEAMVKRRLTLENQLKAVDNSVLKARIQEDLDHMVIQECEKRELIKEMKTQ